MKILNLAIITILTAKAVVSAGQSSNSGYVAVNDSVKLYYQFFGYGKDTVVIADGQIISQYLKNYRGKLKLLVFDVRDRGKSSTLKSGSTISMEGNVEDVEAVRKHFKIKKVNLIGWSYMGAVAAMYASKYPMHTKSLIMMSPMAMTKNSNKLITKPTDFSRYQNELNAFTDKGGKESDPMMFSRLYWRRWLAPSMHDLKKLDDIVNRVPHNLYNEQPANASANVSTVFSKIGAWDFTEVAKGVSCRTLVIYGASDLIPPQCSVEWVQNLNNARYLEFKESGHFIFAEETNKWLETIDIFFRGKWPPKAMVVKRL